MNVNLIINIFNQLKENIQNHFNNEEIIYNDYFNFEELLSNREYNINILEKLYFYLINKCNLLKKLSKNNDLIIFLCCIFKFIHIKNNNFIYHLGEKNNNIYFILKGKCKIFLSKEKEVYMTEEEYILFLLNLYYYDEKELFKRTIINNNNLYGVNSYYYFERLLLNYSEKYKDIKLYSENIINGNIIEGNEEKLIQEKYLISILIKTIKKLGKKGHLLKSYLLNKNYEEYIKRTHPIFIIKDTEEENEYMTKNIKKKCLISYYINGPILSKGDYFNEQFTINHSENVAVVSLEDVYFGIITNDSFKFDIINDNFYSIKKINIESILSHPIFKGVSKEIFENYFFKRFKFNVGLKGDFLFKTGDIPNNIYFLKKGIVEIIYKDKIISIYDNSDIIGAENCYNDDNKYFLSAKIKSDKIEYFSLTNNQMKKILNENKIIRINYKNYISITKNLINENINKLVNKYISNSKIKIDSIFPKISRDLLIKFSIKNILKGKKSYSGPKNLKTILNLKDKESILIKKEKKEVIDKDYDLENIENFNIYNLKSKSYKLIPIKLNKKQLIIDKKDEINNKTKNYSLNKDNSISLSKDNNISLTKEIKILFQNRLPHFTKLSFRKKKLNKINLSNRSYKNISEKIPNRKLKIIKLNEMTYNNYSKTKLKIEKSFNV